MSQFYLKYRQLIQRTAPLVLAVMLGLVPALGGGCSYLRKDAYGSNWFKDEPEPEAESAPENKPAATKTKTTEERQEERRQQTEEQERERLEREKELSELGQRSLERAKVELEMGYLAGEKGWPHEEPGPPPPAEKPPPPPGVLEGRNLHGLALGVRNAGHPHGSDWVVDLRFNNTRGIVPEGEEKEVLRRMAFAVPVALIVDSYLIQRVTWPALNEPWPFFLGLALFDSVNMGWNSRNGSSALPELSGGSYGRIMEQTTQVNYGYIFPWPDSENLAFSVTAGRQARTFFLSDTAVERKDQKKVVFKKASLQVGLRWSPHPWVLLALDDEVVSSGISRESDVTDAAVQQAVDAFDAFQERSLYFSVSVKY